MLCKVVSKPSVHREVVFKPVGSEPEITYSKLTKETLEQVVKYVQS